jgi:autotransporter family porin
MNGIKSNLHSRNRVLASRKNQTATFSRTNALFALSAIALSLSSMQAQANVIIDNNDISVPADQTAPWDISGSLTVGNSGNASLTVTDGSITATGRLYIGMNSGSNGTMILDGSTASFVNAAHDIRVGSSGTGTLTVKNGAYAETTMLILGENANSVGTVNIDGAGTTVNVTGSGSNALSVGASGTGRLNITNGATLLTAKSNNISSYSGGQGIVTVDGVGSSWIAQEQIEVGNSGRGIVNIQNGGLLSTGGHQDLIGLANGYQSDVNVIGAGSKWTSTALNGITVGYMGGGNLNILQGGYVSTSSLNLGRMANSEGKLTVAGTGSTLDITGALSIGSTGSGEVILADQGVINANSVSVNANGVLNIGNAAGSGPADAGVLNTAAVQLTSPTAKLVFNHSDLSGNYQFDAAINGSGEVNVYNGTTVMNGLSNYSGATNVHGGSLTAGAANVFSSNSDFVLQTNGTVDLNDYDQTLLSLTNGGQVTTGAASAGTLLTVSGDYVGNGGTLVLTTTLGDDSSATDQLIVNGDTSGNTTVHINNLNGVGDQTTVGIHLISVGGASNGVFSTDRVIAAGAYEYVLSKGGNGGIADDWYLVSSYVSNQGLTQTPLIRPAAGGYIGMAEFADAAFSHSFHDRQQLVEKGYRSSWGRVEYNRDSSKSYNGNFTTNTNRTLIHLGTDLVEKNNWHAGIMGAYAYGDLTTRSGLTDGKAHGTVNGYSVGGYATWIEKDQNLVGPYIDLYGQYNWFKNTLRDEGNIDSHYRADGFALSAESGYAFMLSDSGETKWTVEPQLQLIYNRFDGADFTDEANARVHNNSHNDFMTRAGVRLQGHGATFKPFMTVNYWHHTGTPQVTLDDITVNSNRAKDLFQAKVGGEAALNKNVSFYGQLNGSWGASNHRTESYGGNVGVKVRW